MRRESKRLLAGPLWVALCMSTSCAKNPAEPAADVVLEPFINLARSSDCRDVRNRLFLVDEQLVLWDREASCADAAYAQRLYEGTTDRLVCYSQDSIAGPVKGCRDERYRADFETMIQNLDKPDLGLGPEHTVEEITF